VIRVSLELEIAYPDGEGEDDEVDIKDHLLGLGASLVRRLTVDEVLTAGQIIISVKTESGPPTQLHFNFPEREEEQDDG
jgi:hypothetical protein